MRTSGGWFTDLYEGPGGLVAVGRLTLGHAQYVVARLDPSNGRVLEEKYVRGHGTARVHAKQWATERHLSATEILRAYDVRDTKPFAAAMTALKAAILRAMRSMHLFPYSTWDDVRATLPLEASDALGPVLSPPEGLKPEARYELASPQAYDLLASAVSREIEEWMRTDAVRALKRLGKRAFEPDTDTDTEAAARENPARRHHITPRGRRHHG